MYREISKSAPLQDYFACRRAKAGRARHRVIGRRIRGSFMSRKFDRPPQFSLSPASGEEFSDRGQDASRSERARDMMDKVPMTAAGYAALDAGAAASPADRAPAHHPGDRRGARPWRSLRERRISRRQGSAVAERGPHRRARGQAVARRGHRRLQAHRQRRSNSARRSRSSTRTPRRRRPIRSSASPRPT